jgi:hypothetical protein
MLRWTSNGVNREARRSACTSLSPAPGRLIGSGVPPLAGGPRQEMENRAYCIANQQDLYLPSIGVAPDSCYPLHGQSMGFCI